MSQEHSFDFSPTPFQVEKISPVVEEVLKLELQGVTINTVDPKSFISALTKLFQEGKINQFMETYGHSFIVCYGGIYRSRKMANFFEEIDIDLVDSQVARGFDVFTLSDLIAKATVENHKINLEGFAHLLGTLFVLISSKHDASQIEGVAALISALVKLQRKNPDSQIQLQIIIIDATEKELLSLLQDALAQI
ncbi:MAG TPA: hypothetical protein VF209_03040 [Patescibacteria group bacterium]